MQKLLNSLHGTGFNPSNFGHKLFSPHIFINLSENINECVQFGADPNKKSGLVNSNVFHEGTVAEGHSDDHLENVLLCESLMLSLIFGSNLPEFVSVMTVK